jgi:emp24/gp25L/p24 family/GOLD
LTADIAIIGAYKVLIFNSKDSAFVNGQGVQTKIVVTVEQTSHNVVDSTFDAVGKFHFTAVESGVHVICLTVLGHSWFNARSKIYFDIQFGDLAESAKPVDENTDAIIQTRNNVAALKSRVDGIRSELKLQRV